MLKNALKFTVKVAVTLIALLVAASLLSTSPASAATKKPTSKLSLSPTLPTRPCADDYDDRNCFWDAGRRGNRKGYSYWVDRKGNVIYLNPKLNNAKKRAAWKAKNRKLKREYWGTYWGHRLCWAKVGNTSRVYCFDGYTETT